MTSKKIVKSYVYEFFCNPGLHHTIFITTNSASKIEVSIVACCFNGLERNPDVLHFFGNQVSPKGVAILLVLVESASFCDRSWHLDSKLMDFLEETGAPLLHDDDD